MLLDINLSLLRGILFTALFASSVSAMPNYWTLPVPLQGEAPDNHHPLTRKLSPDGCALCHYKHYEQWRTSLHAKAVSKGLMGQLPAFDQNVQTDCLNCHAPRAEQQHLWQTKGEKASKSLWGVDCATCHVREHQRYGPRNKPHTPHGSVKRLEGINHAEFCSPCHQFDQNGTRVNGKLLENTYQEWLASPYASAGKTCQHCHLPNGAHEFKGIHDPEMTRKGLKINAHRTATGVHLRAWNDGAGHALPTYATPRIRIILQARDDKRQRVEHVIQRQLAWDEENGWSEQFDTRLLPREAIELTLELDFDQGANIAVRVEPDAYYYEQVYPTLLQLIGADLLPADRRTLVEAMHTSGRTNYLLYQLACERWQGTEASCVFY